MKTIKKLTSVLLLLAIFMAVQISALAAGTVTLKMDGQAGHSYEAYQIFLGDLKVSKKIVNGQEVESKVLSNISWGNGLKKSFIDDTVNGFSGASAEEVAAGISASNFTAEEARDLADDFLKGIDKDNAIMLKESESWTKTVPTGYYLIVESGDVGLGEAKTVHMLKVVTDTVVKPKASKPEFNKKIMDINDSEGMLIRAEGVEDNDILNPDSTLWKDSADYDKGDTVPFKLMGKVAANIDDFQSDYRFIFEDTLSKELTLDEDSFIVKIDGKVLDNNINNYKLSIAKNGNGSTSISITIWDLRRNGAKAGSIVSVFMTAKLTSPVIGATEENMNEARLKYSNDPNYYTKGIPEPPLGNTPWDKVRVFTYKTVVNKVDEDGKTPLKGAGFTLYKKDIKEGKINLREEAWNEDKTDFFDGINAKVLKVYKAGDETTFKFEGLDDGTYLLVESDTPDGYNTIEPVKFDIIATHEEDSDEPMLLTLNGDVTEGTAEFTATTAGGALTTNIVNKKGATLPETGGSGTTLFYFIGGLIAIASATILSSKKLVKRM